MGTVAMAAAAVGEVDVPVVAGGVAAARTAGRQGGTEEGAGEAVRVGVAKVAILVGKGGINGCRLSDAGGGGLSGGGLGSEDRAVVVREPAIRGWAVAVKVAWLQGALQVAGCTAEATWSALRRYRS